MKDLVIKMAFILVDLIGYWVVFKLVLDPIIDYMEVQKGRKITNALLLFMVISAISVVLKSIDFCNSI